MLNFTFLMVLFTKHHLIFMSSETIGENKLASISTLKSSNDVDLVRSYLRDIGRVPLIISRVRNYSAGKSKNICKSKEQN